MRFLRLVFLDLELTALPLQPEGVKPEVLECAVVITDEDLTELDRGHWVKELDSTDYCTTRTHTARTCESWSCHYRSGCEHTSIYVYS